MLLVIAILGCLLQRNRCGGSRPSDKGGPGHPDPEISWGGGGLLRASAWSKTRGAAPLDPPLNSVFGGHPRDRGKCALDGGWAGVC